MRLTTSNSLRVHRTQLSPTLCRRYITVLHNYICLIGQYITVLHNYISLIGKYITVLHSYTNVTGRYITVLQSYTCVIGRYITVLHSYTCVIGRYITVLQSYTCVIGGYITILHSYTVRRNRFNCGLRRIHKHSMKRVIVNIVNCLAFIRIRRFGECVCFRQRMYNYMHILLQCVAS